MGSLLLLFPDRDFSSPTTDHKAERGEVAPRVSGRARARRAGSLSFGAQPAAEATHTVSQLITESEPKGRHVPSLSGHLLCELSDLLFQ